MNDIADPNDIANRRTLELRRAGLGDGAALTEVAARLFEQTFGSANTVEDMRAFLAATYTVERQTAELADPERATWMLEWRDGSAIDPVALGFATLRRGTRSDGVLGDRPAEVQRLYADRGLHGRGVGARLMDTCIAQARAWECDVIWLAVWEKNPRAIAFYEKMAFRKVGRQTFQLGSDIQHDYVMARNLSSPG